MKRALMALVLLAMAGCGQYDKQRGAEGVAVSADASATPGDRERGRAIYNFRCYFCHGYSGDARTVAAEYLSPRPRDFTSDGSRSLTVESIASVVNHGKPGTAMKGFSGILDAAQIRDVSTFVRDEFIVRRAANTRYHTASNGWPDHDRYREAFAFARGEIALDAPAEQMSEENRRGLRLFMGACVSCHDQGRRTDDTARWEIRPVSYPPNASSCMSCHNRDGASLGPEKPVQRSSTYAGRSKPKDDHDPHEIHDRPPRVDTLTALQREGERLYQANCAFCHAADGTGRNWIGGFIEPHPANFTDGRFMAGLTRERMRHSIREGVTGSAMPSWKTVLTDAQINAVVAYIERAFHPARTEVARSDSAVTSR